MSDDDPDYVTLLTTTNPHTWLTAVMHWDKTADSYKIAKCSQPLHRAAAESLARCWAEALHVEVR